MTESYLALIEGLVKSTFSQGKETNHHLLQALLHHVVSLTSELIPSSRGNNELQKFICLIELHLAQEHSVSFYLKNLSVSEKKLGSLTKEHLGMSPLHVIHSRLVLETKRSLLMKVRSHKEIAFDLGFDSPASFSAFIKKRTDMTPTELQAMVTEIHRT